MEGGRAAAAEIIELKLQRVPTPWIWQESERVPDIDTYIARLKEAGPKWPFTVGWIDCLSRGKKLGRGLLMKGRWADPAVASAFAVDTGIAPLS